MRGTDDNGTSIAGEVHEKPLVSESINRGDMDGRKEKKKKMVGKRGARGGK